VQRKPRREEPARILVVEDRPEHVEYIKFLLENSGYVVYSAAREQDILRILHGQEIDLILLDLLLEGRNGLELCTRLRGDERYTNIPILILTSRAGIDAKISGFQAGADDYLTKPFKAQELLARIELLLQKKQLKESEDRYRSFVENLDDLVVMTDSEGIILEVNRKAESYLRTPRERLVGTSFFRYVAEPHRKELRQALQKVLKGKRVESAYVRLQLGPRKEVPFELTAFGQYRAGRFLQAQFVLRDISRREKLEQEIQRYMEMLERQVEERTQALSETQQLLIMSEKMAAIGQLAAGIAHELRNPLSIIGTSVYYLSRVLTGSENPRIQEHLTIIQSEIARSQKIITNLLDFSRRSTAERESADVNKVLQQTLEILEKNFKNQEIEVVTDLQPLPLCFVNVDEMKQAFLNLLLNARDAMPNGGKLTVRSYVHSSRYVAVEIEDTGIGIRAPDLERIFDPFFTTKPENGVGLGLSLVHATIQRNRGKIIVKSEPNRGTVFTVLLPIANL